MSKDMPQELVTEVQKYTNMPWWNGKAYAGFVGYTALNIWAKECVIDMSDLIEDLRAAKLYEHSDKLRYIKDKLEGYLVID